MLPIPEAASFGVHWYAVHTKARQETRAEANLNGLGVETFLPKIRRSRFYMDVDGRRRRIQALFPRYLFVRCEGPPMAHQIRNTRGVTSLLSSHSGPTPIDEEIVDVLRRRADGEGFVEVAYAFKAGESIRVASGPLRDLTGVFDSRLRGSARVAILLQTINSYVRVVIDGEALRPS